MQSTGVQLPVCRVDSLALLSWQLQQGTCHLELLNRDITKLYLSRNRWRHMHLLREGCGPVLGRRIVQDLCVHVIRPQPAQQRANDIMWYWQPRQEAFGVSCSHIDVSVLHTSHWSSLLFAICLASQCM